jgi:4-amino-4-deoxy-L-arabinose transferase-like glycosyltransferase
VASRGSSPTTEAVSVGPGWARTPAGLFWLFVGLHGTLWVILPGLTLPNVHRDILELVNWGQSFEWSYWKHPPLQTWVTEAFLRLTGRSLWGVYLASQVSISICLWAVWRVARDVLSPLHALLSVLLLEGILYYNYNTPKFNQDALQLPLWALTALAFWRGLTGGRRRDWLLGGLAAGLGILSKYAIGVLFVPLAVFLLVHPHGRRMLRTPGPYLALGALAVTIAPHVAWLVTYDFPTVRFFLDRAERQGEWIDHLRNPAAFARNHALVLAPAALLLATLVTGRREERPAETPDRPAGAFLFAVALGPMLTCLAMSLTTGLRLRPGWGTPLWSFIGVFALYHLRPHVTEAAGRRFAAGLAVVTTVWAVVFVGQFVVGPALTGKLNPELFPGSAVARHVTREWKAQYGGRLPIVAGDKWFVENVAFHSADRPRVYDLHDSDPLKNVGASDEALNRRGGVIVWDALVAGDDIPHDWGTTRFPRAQSRPAIDFPAGTAIRAPTVRLGWAVVPPADR